MSEYYESEDAEHSRQELGQLLLDFGRISRANHQIVERITEIVKQQPELCKQELASGLLPLHLAVKKHLPLAVLERMVVCYPEALVVQDERGRTPLHSACSSVHHFDDPALYQLLACQDALSLKDSEGNLALHLSCCSSHGTGQNLQRVRQLVQAYPESLREPNDNGQLPLHVASYYLQDIEDLPVIQFLVDSYRPGISAKDSNGSMPLHLACECVHDRSLLIVRFLFEVYPQAAREGQKDGHTPLHILCHITAGAAVEVARFLVEACPESVARLDRDGRTPLHHVCDGGEDGEDEEDELALIQLLVQSYPDALETKDKSGHTPFDIAVRREYPNANVFRFLAKHCADMLEGNDNNGRDRTPLHIFCDYWGYFDWDLIGDRVGLDCLKALAISEKAVKATDHHGRTPFHLLCRSGASRDSLEILLEKFAGLVYLRDNEGRIPLHSAVGGRLMEEEEYHETISFLLELYPGGVRVTDNDGMMPLELACEKNIRLSLIYQLVRKDPMMNLGLGAGRAHSVTTGKRKRTT